jgi:hypothetical protein
MRYRNIKPLPTKKGRMNLRTSAIGRDARARLFNPSELAAPFEPNMDRAVAPTLVVGEEMFQHESSQLEWEQEPPIKLVPDVLPVDVLAQDRRRGGQDELENMGPAPIRRLYTADADTVSRELDVSSPTAANVAQVLNALLADMSREFVVVRT